MNNSILCSVGTNIRIFPPNNDIHIRFMAILKAEYYSNIQVFGSEYFLTLVLKITGSTGIKGAFFLF